MLKNKIHVKNLFLKLPFVLIILWIAIASLRTVYNVSKLVTEERDWYFLSDEQKREKQFGDLHNFLRFIQKQTEPESNILFYTNDLKAYYLGRYYLYPTKVIGEHEKKIWKPKATYYDYIIIYPANDRLVKKAFSESNIRKYKKLAAYKGQGKTGLIYKK